MAQRSDFHEAIRPRVGSWRRDQHLHAADAQPRSDRAQRLLSRMQWRAAGAQFYPGGAYEHLQELSYRGRGPKGYRRSDERLQEIICERLTDDPFIDARDISVNVSAGEVTLQGSVEDRQQKYAIEDLVADVHGVVEIHNRIAVNNASIEERMSGL